jgi:hypothetical protein
MEPRHRREIREKLAELLREPLANVASDIHLLSFDRYDPARIKELLRAFGVDLPPERLRSLETVQNLVDEVALRVRARQRRERGERDTASVVREEAGKAARPGANAEVAEKPQPEAAALAVPGPAPPGSYEASSPYEEVRIHAAAVYCSDGRVGEQMDEFLHRGLALPRYDRVACPGGPVTLAGRLTALWESRGVQEQIRFLIRAHELQTVVLIAHECCAYYQQRLGIAAAAIESEQRDDLDKAAWAVRRKGEDLEIRGYFARRAGATIRFEPVALSLEEARGGVTA